MSKFIVVMAKYRRCLLLIGANSPLTTALMLDKLRNFCDSILNLYAGIERRQTEIDSLPAA